MLEFYDAWIYTCFASFIPFEIFNSFQSSKTDFILPEGHEEKEKLREKTTNRSIRVSQFSVVCVKHTQCVCVCQGQCDVLGLP